MNDDEEEIDLSVVQDDPVNVAPNATPYNGAADDANSGAVSWLGDLDAFIKGAAQTVGDLRSAGFITTTVGGSKPASAPAPAAGTGAPSIAMGAALALALGVVAYAVLKSK